jgi:hypothetical protein
MDPEGELSMRTIPTTTTGFFSRFTDLREAYRATDDEQKMLDEASYLKKHLSDLSEDQKYHDLDPEGQYDAVHAQIFRRRVRIFIAFFIPLSRLQK